MLLQSRMNRLLLLASLLGIVYMIEGAPQYSTFSKSAECGIRLPRLPTVKTRRLWRIGNGYATQKNQWPWMVSILYYNGTTQQWRHGCGASLIDRSYLLTAAHCVRSLANNPKRIRLRFAEHDLLEQERGQYDSAVERIIVHHLYGVNNSAISNHDIALLKLDKGVTLDDKVNIVCLPSNGKNFTGNERLTIIGWGRTTSNSRTSVMQQVEVPILNKNACLNSWMAYYSNDPAGMGGLFCTSVVDNRDSCKGDSGGPLMMYEDGRWVQYGIVSAGSPDCGSDAYPSVNVKTADYIDWIARVISTTKDVTVAKRSGY